MFLYAIVAALFGGQNAAFSRIIYALVGISGLICISLYFNGVSKGDNADDSRGIESRKLNYGTEFAEDDNDGLNRKK